MAPYEAQPIVNEVIFARISKGTVPFIHTLRTRIMTIMSRFYERGKIFNSFHFTGDGDKDEVRNFTARKNTRQFFPQEMREKKYK